MTACLAGCEKTVGTGTNMVFQNCSCIQSSGNSSAVLGLCKRDPECANKLQYSLILSLFLSIIYSLAAIPGYMVLLRCMKSEEKSLGIGLHAFCIRVFAGIPAPIYFGALIDRTCLHWGTQKCGEPGACRIYDINSFRTAPTRALFSKASSSVTESVSLHETPEKSWNEKNPRKKPELQCGRGLVQLEQILSHSESQEPSKKNSCRTFKAKKLESTRTQWKKQRKRLQHEKADSFPISRVFLLSLTCAYLSKALSGVYMISMLTQIERRFDIPTSVVGFINGSFEIEKPFVDCIRELFWNEIAQTYHDWCRMCGYGPGVFLNVITSFPHGQECVKQMKSLMWIYVLVGNIIRGIGETPIIPLGISYIEDFANPESSPLYIGILEVGRLAGPVFGLLLGSFCARVYVDIGSVNTDDLTITPSDTRWVGAWWMGLLVCAGVNILTSIPFFFLPKALPKKRLQDNVDGTKYEEVKKYRERAKEENLGNTKDFLPLMKSLSSNPIYMLFTLVSVLQISGYNTMFTFLPKYLEQQYGKSTAEAVFLIGVYTLPPVCLGYLIGGFIMKKFKITVKKAAYIAFCLSLSEYLLYLCNFLITCDNVLVAGLTASNEGVQHQLYAENTVLADCNTRCSCLTNTWDPVCGDNGLAYMSACLAGCKKFVGTGTNLVFQNCSCIRSSGNSSAVLGLCNKGPECANKLQYFLILTIIVSFIYSLAAIPGYMVLLRRNALGDMDPRTSMCVKSEEKSLGVGLHTFCLRILVGIPAPVYFGALIDRTCLHWGTLRCGEPGACRIYDINSFRHIYLGVTAALKGSSYLPALFILILARKFRFPGDINSSEPELVEMKLTEKENECTDVHRSLKIENDRELKTKL
ncbi:Solute carrier organic anion transporter family member 1A1 [Apodemus speciosus]|uniref:Solute carrier organic anion transporter family member n=1 Tax=Apodemus speciosus TaxID=105296 RepID=A0ABQ0EWR7_APOSI